MSETNQNFAMKISCYGDPILRKKAVPVDEITPEIKALAQEMLKTMYEADGVGLAAEQIGRTEAICVIDVPVESQGAEYAPLQAGIRMPMVLINPVVSELEGAQRGSEGCLSFPKIFAPVTRALSCRVDYMGLDGKHYSVKTYGLLARAVQHEVDHLNGIVFIDHFSTTQSLVFKSRLAKLARTAAPKCEPAGRPCGRTGGEPPPASGEPPQAVASRHGQNGASGVPQAK